MAKIIQFPTFLENTIRLNSATHWICKKNQGSMFSYNKSYPLKFNKCLEFNEWTDEYYVIDNCGSQNYAFYTIEGDFVNMEIVENEKKEKDLLRQAQ